MNKKVISFFGLVFLVFGFTLTSCDFLDVLNLHDHTYSSAYEYNETYHWHPSTCGHDVKSNEEEHTFTSVVADPTYESGGYTTYTCSVCGYSYRGDETSQLEHNYSSTWSHDEDYHWHACIDEGYEHLRADEESHSYVTSVTDPTYKDGGYTTYTCSVCGYSYIDDETSPLPITVTWQDYDGTILEVDENVPYGSMPSYDGTTPIREDDSQYTYSFSGWSPRVGSAYNDITYTAEYKSENIVYSSNPYKYTIKGSGDNKYISIVDYNDDYTALVIPSSIGGLPVEEIERGAFQYTNKLREVTIPNTIKTIGIGAFSHKPNTYKVDYGTQYYYHSENTFMSINVPFTFENAPSGILGSLGGDVRCKVFWKPVNDNIISVDGVQYKLCYDENDQIYAAVCGTSGTSTYEIADMVNNYPVKAIVDNAFCDDYEIIKRNPTYGDTRPYYTKTPYINSIPSSIKYIGNNTSKHINFDSLDVETLFESLVYIGCPGNQFPIDSIFYKLNIEEVDLPNIQYIGDMAMAYCSSLKAIILGEKLKYIDYSAFEGCSSLTSINIPDSVTTIGSSAFEDCSNLTTLTIGENSQLASIGSYAFSGCSSLTSIFIPSSVATIGDRAFQSCSNLTIYCEASSKPSGWSSLWNYSNRPVVWNCTYDEYLETIA